MAKTITFSDGNSLVVDMTVDEKKGLYAVTFSPEGRQATVTLRREHAKRIADIVAGRVSKVGSQTSAGVEFWAALSEEDEDVEVTFDANTDAVVLSWDSAGSEFRIERGTVLAARFYTAVLLRCERLYDMDYRAHVKLFGPAI